MQQVTIDFEALTAVQRQEFNRIAGRIRRPFQAYIDNICERNAGSLRFWSSGVAYRNPYILFYQVCRLVFAAEMVRSGASRLYGLTRLEIAILRETCREHSFDATSLESVSARRLPSWKRPFLPVLAALTGFRIRCEEFAKLAGRLWRRFAAARATRSLARDPGETPIVLADTYSASRFFDGDMYRDRYFGGLLENCEDPSEIFFLFTPHEDEDFTAFYRKLRSHSIQFIVKEDYLSFVDMFLALLSAAAPFRIALGDSRFEGMDLRPLILKTLRQGRVQTGPVESFLNYRFMGRLRKRGVKVRLLLDYFENQWMDRGLNLGFRRSYPDSFSLGYQGYPYLDFCLNFFTTTVERNAGVVPRAVGVIGRGFIGPAREFCPMADVVLVPAFRYAHVWESAREVPDPQFCSVLVILPYYIHLVREYVEKFTAVAARLGSNFRFHLRAHPEVTRATREAAADLHLPDSFSWVSGAFVDNLEKCSVLASTASSACLEGLAKGVRLIVLASENEPTSPCVPPEVPGDAWRMCYSTEEIAEALLHFKNTPGHFSADAIRREFFEPVNRNTVLRLLHPDKYLEPRASIVHPGGTE